MRVLVTRPEPDATALKTHLVTAGHEVFIEPLLAIEYQPIDPEDILDAQALIATSRNGLRALAASEAWEAMRELPVFTVGPGTAAEARALGMASVMAGPRSARELIPIISEVAEVNAGPLIHLAGETLAFDLGAELVALGFHVLQPVVYRSVAKNSLSDATVARLGGGGLDAVILLSPQTAAIYARLIRWHGLEAAAQEITHVCLSDAVANQLASLAVPKRLVAALPNLEEILGLVGSLAAQSG
jgi:uroporphyrinogen-III synthase